MAKACPQSTTNDWPPEGLSFGVMGWRTGSQYGIFPNLGFKQRSHLHCLHCLHCHVSRRNMEMSAVQKATRPSSSQLGTSCSVRRKGAGLSLRGRSRFTRSSAKPRAHKTGRSTPGFLLPWSAEKRPVVCCARGRTCPPRSAPIGRRSAGTRQGPSPSLCEPHPCVRRSTAFVAAPRSRGRISAARRTWRPRSRGVGGRSEIGAMPL